MHSLAIENFLKFQLHLVGSAKRLLTRPYLPLMLAAFVVLAVSPLRAQDTFTPSLTVGAGIRTDYLHTDFEIPTVQNTDNFQLNDLRLYFSGEITPFLGAMVNTDYIACTSSCSNGNTLQVLDAVGMFHPSSKFNVWFGRFLPPSDRSNLYGPFYANEWQVYTDGVQDGYPSIFQGRDNGAMYWGDFNVAGKQVQIDVGAFDGSTLNDGSNSILGAARVMIDLWDPEGGYYENGTYYGDKKILAIGGATQVQDGKTASTLDFLLDRPVLNGGAFTVEAEYSRYNRLGGYNGDYMKSEGGYGLVSFLFPKPIGPGKIDVMGKFAVAEFTDGIAENGSARPPFFPSYHQKTTEVNLSYIIKQFDARIMAYGRNTTFPGGIDNYWDAGVGLQFQLSKKIDIH